MKMDGNPKNARGIGDFDKFVANFGTDSRELGTSIDIHDTIIRSCAMAVDLYNWPMFQPGGKPYPVGPRGYLI